MGVLICLYDWSAAIDWNDTQGKCEAAMARLGRNVERYVYQAGQSAKTRIRKTPLSSSADGQWYLGAYNFDGGEVNLPCPHASVVCISNAVGKTFYLFDDLLTFEPGPVAKLSGWLAEM